MFNSRPHERHDLYTPVFNGFHRIRTIGLFWILLLLLTQDTEATPIQSHEENLYEKRDPNSNNNQFSGAKLWIPVIVALVILVCIALMVYTKRSLRKSGGLFSFVGLSEPGAPSVGAPGVARELTAEQLAGTINGENRPANSNAPRTARRPRRPRRTPSQMSVTSLPPYNKEPGEEELVIFRGRDMEDATMPAAIVRSSADDDRASMSSQDHSQVSRYSPMPTSPHNMPLLHNGDTEGDLSLQSLASGEEDGTRSGMDDSLLETSSLHNGTADPRGEAPPYFEVVDANERLESPEPAPASPSTPPALNHRRSGFRNLLNRMSMVSHATGHNRTDSNRSAISSSMSHGHEPSARGGSGHRASPSGSGSLLSPSMFRTLSRQRSNHTLNSNRLNSPSLISLNSISAPLTHTVMRTEYTYPKTGPTAEQLKVISSRESFSRFGVPYGPDAVAFAASSSRQDLLPPPDFVSAVPEAASPRSPSRAGPSRLRSPSNVAELAAQNSPTDSTQLPITNFTRAEHQSSVDVSAAQPERSSSISKSHNSLSGSPTPPTISPTIAASSSSALPPPSSQVTNVISEFGQLSSASSSLYHDQTGSSMQSESRASRYTFQTAAESLSRSTGKHPTAWNESVSSDAVDSMPGSGSATPRLEGQHVQEPTDATITPDLVRAASLPSAGITPTPAEH